MPQTTDQTNVRSLVDDTIELPTMPEVLVELNEIVADPVDFGCTHADVGSVVAIKWFLPEESAIAIRYDHEPARDPFHRSLSSLIHLADHVAWSAGNPSTMGTPKPLLDHEVHDQVQLDPQQVEQVLPRIRDDFAAAELPW
jgi:HD-like signal output (HDOD) protein